MRSNTHLRQRPPGASAGNGALQRAQVLIESSEFFTGPAASAASGSKRAKQVTNLAIYFLWTGHRLGDFLSKQFAEPLAKAMDGGFDAINRQTKIAGQVRVASRFGVV